MLGSSERIPLENEEDWAGMNESSLNDLFHEI